MSRKMSKKLKCENVLLGGMVAVAVCVAGVDDLSGELDCVWMVRKSPDQPKALLPMYCPLSPAK